MMGKIIAILLVWSAVVVWARVTWGLYSDPQGRWLYPPLALITLFMFLAVSFLTYKEFLS